VESVPPISLVLFSSDIRLIGADAQIIHQFEKRPPALPAELNILCEVIPPVPLCGVVTQGHGGSSHLREKVALLMPWQNSR